MGLNVKQQRAVSMVAVGHSGKDVANTLGLREETISKWRQLPAFQAAVNALLEESRTTTLHRLESLSSRALDTLEACMGDSEAPWSARIQAVKITLDTLNLRPLSPGPTSTEEVERQAEHEEIRTKKQQAFESLLANMGVSP